VQHVLTFELAWDPLWRSCGRRRPARTSVLLQFRRRERCSTPSRRVCSHFLLVDTHCHRLCSCYTDTSSNSNLRWAGHPTSTHSTSSLASTITNPPSAIDDHHDAVAGDMIVARGRALANTTLQRLPSRPAWGAAKGAQRACRRIHIPISMTLVSTPR
jgi:hypothetical protein